MAILGSAVFLANMTAIADDCFFYRIVSTQETQFISVDTKGLLAWSNSTASASVRIEAQRSMTGIWTNNFPTSPTKTNGQMLQVRVPLTDNIEEWIVALQSTTTLAQAEAIFDAEEMVWRPLAFDMMKMAVISIPPGTSLTNLTANPSVRYVEKNASYSIY